jgi:hypothetical protein
LAAAIETGRSAFASSQRRGKCRIARTDADPDGTFGNTAVRYVAQKAFIGWNGELKVSGGVV